MKGFEILFDLVFYQDNHQLIKIKSTPLFQNLAENIEKKGFDFDPRYELACAVYTLNFLNHKKSSKHSFYEAQESIEECLWSKEMNEFLTAIFSFYFSRVSPLNNMDNVFSNGKDQLSRNSIVSILSETIIHDLSTLELQIGFLESKKPLQN